MYREKLAEDYASGDESLIDADTVCASLVDEVLEGVVRSSLREDEVVAHGEETSSFVKTRFVKISIVNLKLEY